MIVLKHNLSVYYTVIRCASSDRSGRCELNRGAAPPTPENIGAVMELYPVGERFFQEFALRQVLLNAAKNGSGPSAADTSSRVEGPSTAGPAGKTASPVPWASPEPTGGSAPTASTP
jgi:hypothetical protein